MDVTKTRHDYLFYQMAGQNAILLSQLSESFKKETSIENILKKIEKNDMSEEEANKMKTSEGFQKLATISFNIRMLGIQTILNCAFCLESFINDYGSEKFGNSYFGDHLDRLDVKSKWLVIPKLATGKSIKKGGVGYGHLRTIVGIRNKLVHSKGKNIAIEEFGDSAVFNEMIEQTKQVYKCLRGVKIILDEFKELDPDYEPLSIYEKEVTEDNMFDVFFSTFLSNSKPEDKE